MTELITPQVSDRICKHMNDDHADAVVLYVRHYGNLPEASSAHMLSIDAEGMELLAQVHGQEQPVRVPFASPLKDAKEAHVVLVDMLKSVRSPAAEASAS